MKFKGFGNRAYNIFFHLHTVSGIVLSVALFVIFFAGAFTLFKNEFYLWENPAARKISVSTIDVRKVITEIKTSLPDFDFNDDTYITFPTAQSPVINVYGHLKPEGTMEEIHYSGKMNPVTFKVSDKAESTLGETLYKLHYFAQIPFAGMWISGFVSLFFIFAVLTGVLVHWKNMLTKFWSFSMKGSWKQIWTNSHTVFGLLGLPYQLMYAVTGAFYLLLILVLMPAVMIFYEGKPEKVYALAYPMYGVSYKEDAKEANNLDNLYKIKQSVYTTYGAEYTILAIQTHHVNKEDGAVNFRLESKDPKVFSSNGCVGYRLKDGSEIYNALPEHSKKLTYSIVETVMHLHFGSFGGLFVKGVYFVLALFSCFVFVGGILIWKEARNNPKYTDKQRKFHHAVTKIFLAICFTLFPAIAVLFSAELLVPKVDDHSFWVNTVFFILWLLMALGGIFCLKTEKELTKTCLLVGSVLSLAIPVVNGIITEDWFWNTELTQVWAIDVIWLLVGVLSITIYSSIQTKKPKPSVMN